MAKKKKKNALTAASPERKDEAHDGFRDKTPKASATTVSERIAQVRSVRLVTTTTSSSSTFNGSNLFLKVILSAADAAGLDILSSEPVIVLSQSKANHAIIGGMIGLAEIASNSLSSTTTEASPLKTPIKGSSHLASGAIKVSPASMVDLLFPPEDLSGTDPSSARESTTTSTPSVVLKDAPSTPSSPFSFKSCSPSSSSQTPSSASKSALASKPPAHHHHQFHLWMLPADSLLGQFIITSICCTAKTLLLRIPDHDASLDWTRSQTIFKRIVLAHCVGRYVQPKEHLKVSFQGKGMELVVVDCVKRAPQNGPIQKPIEEDLAKLTIQDDESSPEMLDTDAEQVRNAVSHCSLVLYKIDYSTKIEIVQSALPHPQPVIHSDFPIQPRQLVAGLSATIEQVKAFIMPALSSSHWKIQVPRGILLHGPSGVGKSSLSQQLVWELESLCQVDYVNCISLQSQSSVVGQAERALSRLFRSPSKQDAAQPARSRLLILDDIHLICPRRGGYSPGTDRLAATLLALMDGVERNDDHHRIIILAITSNPSLLDPALRRPGRMDTEVEVPLPEEAATRAEILKFHVSALGGTCVDDIVESDWLELAKMAKGFNGADCMLAVKEALRMSLLNTSGGVTTQLSIEQLKAAIRATKPSAIKSVTVEIPSVHWSSIGGMDSVKRELREAIEGPLEHADLFRKLDVPAPRGILLYGPPGCSKTLMARALATEGKMNFLAVKGPELLSKWLGESERALASLFRRARMASPCIIFFDEIDAIATKRGSGDAASSSRLLSQLLSELDGVNNTGSNVSGRKVRVFVVGATNRPDLLDNALTRPGRIDRMIYVGVPDSESRAQIFNISLKCRSRSEDIDISYLARDDISHGFSGAEIVAICRDAALLALEETDDLMAESEPRVEMRHLLKAVDAMKKQITPEMLEFYDSFRRKTTLVS